MAKQWSTPPEMQIDPTKKYKARMETDKGTMVIELFADKAPKSVNNFVFLSREGYYEGAASFDPEKDVYITNSVFRMPPGDDKPFRKPSEAEVDYYRPFVFEIIRLIDPLVILLTGNIACQSVLRRTGITSVRGQWTRLGDRWLMPIFHPSYLLRNPSREPGSPKALMWEDIREARRKYDELAAGRQ